VAKNPFRDVLESEEAAAPAAAGRNPFRQRVQQIDAAASTFDAGRQYDRDLDVAVETGQPMSVVEPFGSEIDFERRTLQRLTTVADPSDVGELPPDRRIGLIEQISRMEESDWLKRVPFSPLPMVEAVDIYEASQRVKTNSYADLAAKEVRMSEALLYPGSGRAVNPEPGFAAKERAQRLKTVEDAWRARDAAKIEKYIHERIEMAERGQTFGAKVFDGVSYLPSWMIEFAMTGGMAQIGSEAARGAVLKTLQGYAKTAAGRTLLTGAGWTGGAITRTTLGLPLRVGEEIVERRIDHIAVGPNGELSIATPAESWATSIVKGWGSVAIEAGSETSGSEILRPLAALGAAQIRRLPFGSRLYDAMRQAYLAIHPEPGAAANFAQRFFLRAGYDGFVEELGEERVATILEGLVGTEDFGAGPDAGPLARIRAGLSQDLQPGNLAVEAAVLAVPGAAKVAAGAATRGFTTEAQRTQRPEGTENIGQEPPVAATEGGQPAGTGPAQPDSVGIEEQARLLPGAPAASERDSFQGPQYFTYEDYAGLISQQGADVGAAARAMGVSVKGESQENAARLVGGAIEEYTSRPEPAPMIEGEPHPGALTYPEFYARYGLALAEHRKNPEQAAWLARYGQEQISGPRGLYRALQDEWRAIQAWDLFYKLTGQERPVATEDTEGTEKQAPSPSVVSVPSVAEPLSPDWPRTEAEAREIQSEQDSIDTQADLAEFFGQPPAADLPPAVAQEPTPAEAGFIRRMLHKFGIKSLDGYEPISNKDLSRFWRYVQLPFDIARSFPQFAPVFGVQRARELAKQVLDRAFAEKLKPYFDLDTKAQKAVDELLIAQEQQPGGEIVGKLLAQLTPRQYAAYTAVRDGLDDAARMLIEHMRNLGVPEERIAEFEGRIGSYIPHKWYGPWAVVVKEKGPDGRMRTSYMSAVHTKDRFTERERLLEMFPGATVDIIQRTKMEYETFQDAPSWAVNKMLDVIAEQAEKQAQKAGKPYDPSTADAMRQAFKDLYKAKGFGMHFIKRAETPGWTADLRLPLAEYFAGFSGFLTKMEAAMAFTEAMEGIDPQKTPSLHRYASEYIRYVMGDQFEWGRLKSGMYLWYLFGNLKSAAVNVSGNLMMGWPELSKRTRWSAARLMTAMADVAADQGGRPGPVAASGVPVGATQDIPATLSDAERDFIGALEAQGYLDAKMTSEISARGGNAILKMAWGPAGKAVSFADVFRHMERLNRTSMAVALHRAGVTDVAEAAGIIDTAHFHYAKGNRPPLMRGGKSAMTIFRSYTLNQLTWMKNQIKAGEYGALGRHMLAWTLTGGLKAMPLAAIATGIYVGATGRDPEEDMADLLGETPAEILMRGLPTQAGVSLTGSVAMSDLVPELDPDKDLQWQALDWMGGVVSDIPGRVNRVATDLKNRQYLRALEDASPEALRNPLAAWRLYSQGNTTRRGSPLIDWETGEQIRLNGLDAALKAMGFQPDQIPRAYEKQKLAEMVGADRAAIKQQWVDRFYLAQKIGDQQGMREVIAERAEHEAAMRERKRPLLVVSEKEIAEGVASRMDPANMPKGDTLRAYLSLYRSGDKKEN